MRGVSEARAAMLLLVCVAIDVRHVDAQRRSLFQTVTNSTTSNSNSTTTLFFAATSSSFNPATTTVAAVQTVTTTTTTSSSSGTTTTSGGGGGVIGGGGGGATTTSVPMGNTENQTTPRPATIPTTAPTFTTPINVTVPRGPETEVVEEIEFDTPDPAEEFTMDFDNTSEYFGVGVVIPAGAWPAGDTRRPTMSIVRFITLPTMPAGATVAGDMVEFGPSGIVFSRAVAITVPMRATVAGKEYTVRKYDESIAPIPWELKMGDRPAIQGGAGTSNRITGETSSFSLYGAVEQDPPLAETTPTEGEDPAEEDEGGGGRKCNGGCVAGAVIGTLAGVGLIGGGGYFAYMKREEWLPALMGNRGGDDDDEPPIQRQDARRGDDDDGDDDDGARTNV